MNNGVIRIDIIKLLKYFLKYVWLFILLAVIGAGVMFFRTSRGKVDTYTAFGTMYVYNSNPNLVNYQYASSNDLTTAVELVNTYLVVVKSNKVMDVVADRLMVDYPGIVPEFIASTLSMGSVSETGVVEVSSTTVDPQMSADIVNAVLDVAPAEIIRVVNAGSVEVIDYAMVPEYPNSRHYRRRLAIGAGAGLALAGLILLLIYLFNQKIRDASDLTENYTPPVLASIKREKKADEHPGAYLLTEQSPMEITESYAKLRMNLFYTLVGKERHTVVVTSPISGEGKSTIVANLALSCAHSGKKVLLIDGDMRRGCQRDIFNYNKYANGLSEVLVGSCRYNEVIIKNIRDTLDLMPSGQFPPNPAEMLASDEMSWLLSQLEEDYNLVLIDMPPINIVSDPLVVSSRVAGCLFVARQNYSDQRDIRKALIAAEMTKMDVLGFIFYGEDVEESNFHNRKYYKNYYSKYDTRQKPNAVRRPEQEQTQAAVVEPAEEQKTE
ncbi:MAG: polysaccharide biosynthesis tyrosine autokinase [Oscillospiraceae bacterium]|nr:polysaccharide biosynthesis tyrosine autokinase [Oscillospiraceae bacterium]